MSDTPELMTHERIMTGEEYVSYSDYLSLQKERDQYRRNLELIAEDCEAWLNSENDEPSAEFIKLVAKYAREAIK
jgi:hypothetical protein